MPLVTAPSPEQLTPDEAADAYAAVGQIRVLVDDLQSVLGRMASAAVSLTVLAAEAAYSGNDRQLMQAQTAASTDAQAAMWLMSLLSQRMLVAAPTLTHTLATAADAESADDVAALFR